MKKLESLKNEKFANDKSIAKNDLKSFVAGGGGTKNSHGENSYQTRYNVQTMWGGVLDLKAVDDAIPPSGMPTRGQVD